MNTFPVNLLLKASVVYAKNYDFLQFIFRGQPYRFRDISQTSELKSTTGSTWLIHIDGLCNYLELFQKQHSAVCLKITAASLIRNTLAIISSNLLKQDLTFSSNTFSGPFIMWILLPRRHLLLLLVVVLVVTIVVVVLEVVVVEVVIVIVLVAVVEVVKSWHGLVNTSWGPGPVNTNWGPGPGPGACKYKDSFKTTRAV